MVKFSSTNYRQYCAFAHIDSYVKKLEKNTGAKILALSIAVFWGNYFEVLELWSFSLYISIKVSQIHESR